MNDQPMLTADFDLDAWIDGTTGITAKARVIQRGDLVAVRQQLEEELRVARRPRQSDVGIGDRTSEGVREELDEVNSQIWASAIVVTMQDRTEEHRREIRNKAVKDLGLDSKKDPGRHRDVLAMVEIADAIIKVETPDGKELPLGSDGFGWERLDKILKRCGEASLMELSERYNEMKSKSPAVQAPFSPSSSPGQGGTT